MVPKRLHEQTIRLSDVPGETSNGVQPQQPLRGHGSGVTDQGHGSGVTGQGQSASVSPVLVIPHLLWLDVSIQKCSYLTKKC